MCTDVLWETCISVDHDAEVQHIRTSLVGTFRRSALLMVGDDSLSFLVFIFINFCEQVSFPFPTKIVSQFSDFVCEKLEFHLFAIMLRGAANQASYN